MKKLMILICIMLIFGILSAEYILRDSQSGTKFEEFEYLQGGILYRFDFRQVNVQGMDGETTKMWKYKEFWLPEEITEDELQVIIKKTKMEKKAKPTSIKVWKNETIKPKQKLKRYK